ncbi:Protein DA1 like [Macleaya cordata]|uniref:Protein DA1 like n=1 Tax=Macleaya cordata TaxID=56857 RepID=A0A200R7D5_MACCD|nr:Protein DA1 like [Macleaya cordata]
MQLAVFRIGNKSIAPRTIMIELLTAVAPRHQKYVSLGDVRMLCLKCLDSAIMSTDECQPLFEDIQDFYEGLNMKVEINFPLLLVERSALNDAVDAENAHTLHTLPEIRGICSSVELTVPAIVRKPRRVGNLFTGIGIKRTRLGTAKVTGILVLFGYPRLLCGEILAHEMMHAWFRQNGYSSNMRDEIEEGMAEVLAHMWLESEMEAGNGGSRSSRKGQRSLFEKELGRFFKENIEKNQNEVYGGGFRAGYQAVKRHGLRDTLQHIKETGDLP